MFESGSGAAGLASTADVLAWIAALPQLDRAVDDAERIAQIGALERLKSAAAAAQAVVTADLVASQRARQFTAGVPAERAGQGIAAQVALARRESPHRGRSTSGWHRR